MNENKLMTKQAIIFFNSFMWVYQVSVSLLCLYYHIYLLMIMLIINFGFSNFNWYNIKKGKYIDTIRYIYIELIFFMAVGTISLGMSYGFYLYGISTLTILYYIKYLSKHINQTNIDENLIIVAIIISYIMSYVFTLVYGPIYTINDTIAVIFFMGNSLTVFAVLIIYMRMYIGLIFKTEGELEKMAHYDKLTGLFNRHYLLSYLNDNADKGFENSWIAIIDIDNFKQVNDTYGHNGGDYILKNVANIAKKYFDDSIVVRWGGEEFIILASGDKTSDTKLDEMRINISETVMDYEDQKINITVTIGIEKYSKDRSTDQWISLADKKLYEGKNSGKNKVVY